MTALTEPRAEAGGWEVSRDRADAYIARDRRWALSAGRAMPDRVHGSAIFADISGFTPLTEGLARELGPQRGAEELTATLSRVFHAVIAELDAYDGNVIYFSGDAITAWIDGDDGTRAGAAALGMQAAIARTGTIVTPAGTTVQLSMKVAIAVGDARRFVVGDPDVQLIDVLAGRLIDQLAEAEHHAQKGEIMLDASAIEALGTRALCGNIRVDGGTRRACRVLDTLLVEVQPTGFEQPPTLPEDIVRAWLLPAVYERLRAGRGEFLAELRPAVPVFVRFGGIDYDEDDDAIAKLDDFVRAAQRIFDRYGGNLLQLTLGDKGAYLYGVFGSPLAHEDDAARAAAAVLELRDLEKTTAAREIQVGLTQGGLRSGTYGHEDRRTFVCLGDAVNLAARLMSAAPYGGIYVAGPVRAAAGDNFLWEQLPDLTVKGKTEPVEVWSLDGSLERVSRRKTRFTLELIGRTRELALLDQRLEEAVGGEGRIIGIAAEAGMGKSRLVAEFVRVVRRRGSTVAFGECEAFGTKNPYFVWREIWRRLFGIDDSDPTERQIAGLEARLEAIDPALVPRAPLLEAVLAIPIPDSDLTRSFDAKLRKTSLEDLLATCLRARAGEAPFVAVLEDCHWIDELSRDLLQVLTRAAANLPVLFVVAYRPAAEPGGALGIERLPGFSELALDRMEPEEVGHIIRSRLEQLLGDEVEVPDELVRLIADRAEGNPLYVEELLNYIVAQGVDLADPAALERVQLPESLHTLVLSRIDAAAEAPRRTVKVASVVGRAFRAPILPGAYEELGTLDDVLGHLDALRSLDLIALDREAEQSWMFKHAITQEVAYESLPFAARSVLHGRIGDYLEHEAGDDVEHLVPLLEHHYWRSDRSAKKREYLWKAAAAAQATYANNAAVAYYLRLIPLLAGSDSVEATLGLVRVLHVIGEIQQAQTVVAEARVTAASLSDPVAVARCDQLLGESARRLGRFDDAEAMLDEAYAGFEAAEDQAGLGEVLQIMGTVNAQRGRPDAARERYEASLAIRERLGDGAAVAGLLNNLGIVAQQQGDPVRARAHAERAMELYTEIGDRRRIGTCEVNLAWMDSSAGDNESARLHCERAIALAREVGDRLNLAIAQNNLGDALRDMGRLDDAAAAYAEAVRAYHELDDRGPIMALFEDVAVLASRRGDPGRAFQLLGAADSLREALGSPRTDAAAEHLLAEVSASTAALGAEGSAGARERGRSLTLDQAVELTIGLVPTAR